MPMISGAHLPTIMLRAPGNVQRALKVRCPVCREPEGRPCRIEGGVNEVHDRREAAAYHTVGIA